MEKPSISDNKLKLFRIEERQKCVLVRIPGQMLPVRDRFFLPFHFITSSEVVAPAKSRHRLVGYFEKWMYFFMEAQHLSVSQCVKIIVHFDESCLNVLLV